MPAACNFYILQDARENGRLLFCCALIEKLHAKNHRAYVHCQNEAEALAFNDLLWAYKDIGFIPHGLAGEHPASDCPIQIGFDNPPADFQDILILLKISPELPDFYSSFNRIVEIVDQNPETKETLRMHYQVYRAQGCEIKTHTL